MPSRHYDAVVIGRSIGALAAGALLARRDLRVLVLGQGDPDADYFYEGRRLRRRAFTLLSASSPVFSRILTELAQTPRFRRLARPLDPILQVVRGALRLDVPPDPALFERELDRELPGARHAVAELHEAIAVANASLDRALAHDLVWPPATLRERLESARALSGVALASEPRRDLLARLPAGHPFRDAVVAPARFASNLAPPGEAPPALSLARLYGAWIRGVQATPAGERDLEELFVARILADGGEVRLGARAAEILVQRGSVAGVREDGEEEPVGADVVVTDLSGELVAELTRGEGITPRARRSWPRLTASVGRFVVSLVVRDEGVPAALAEEAFLIPEAGSHGDARLPTVHLARATAAAGETTLVAEALLGAGGALPISEAREAVVAAVRAQVPFLDRHLVLVDSPHDGLPLADFSSGRRRDIDRVHVTRSRSPFEPMRWQWSVEPPGFLELGGEPVRGPVPGTFLAGPTVLPGLGQEGELLAAWSAARAITRRDGPRQRVRRHLWTKIETA
ncbi:MAG: phytoene dehydrogenase [Polyangiaceae bacterium]|nr:phytoene dehydrogenase [Polyangiaceae bacterium]